MTAMLAALIVFAGYLVVAFKLDRVAKHMTDTADRYFSMQEAFRKAERAYTVLAGKVEHMEAHFTYPPVTGPVPLPGVDEETAPEPKAKRSRKR